MSNLNFLNQGQYEAVINTEGAVRIVAGPGSGKTNVTVCRVGYLVNDCGIDPSNILCITFTRKAAYELKDRLKKVIGEKASFVSIYTYHALCLKILQDDGEKILLPKKFQVMSEDDRRAVLKEIFKKLDDSVDREDIEYYLRGIEKVKRKNDYVVNMCSTENCRILEAAETDDDIIIEEFLQYQKKSFSLDFNDLLNFTIYLFEQRPGVLAKWQKKFNYILVDETQDTTFKEMKFIDMLAGLYGNLFVVGDPDQNIYEWRGSDVNVLVNFDKSHQPTKTIILNQNYRSTPQILHCANSLIDKNILRLKKDMFAENADGEPVIHYHMKNEYEEADKIAEIIKEIREKTNCSLSDFAILFRSSSLARVIETKLTKHGIPYEIVGGTKFFNRVVVRDIMAYLRLIVFDDDISFKCIISKPSRKFGERKLQRLLDLQTDKSLFNTLAENLDDPVFKNSKARDFVSLIIRVRKELNEHSLFECVNSILTESGYEEYIRKSGDTEDTDVLAEFKRIVCEYETANEGDVTFEEFINHIALQSADNGERSADAVKLMTIHTSKGQEFENVFVIGLSEKIFPSARTLEERKENGLEEERRLCYVAITRAKKRLFLFDSEGFGENFEKNKLPSRFLKDIGEENYTRIGKISEFLQWEADRYIRTHCGGEDSDNGFCEGDIVYHKQFGKGRVSEVNIQQGNCVVFFEKVCNVRMVTFEHLSKINNYKKNLY